jgi:hypothetical protein
MWFIPDRRVERTLTAVHADGDEIAGHTRSHDGE